MIAALFQVQVVFDRLLVVADCFVRLSNLRSLFGDRSAWHSAWWRIEFIGIEAVSRLCGAPLAKACKFNGVCDEIGDDKANAALLDFSDEIRVCLAIALH